jgi:hypothetical protein
MKQTDHSKTVLIAVLVGLMILAVFFYGYYSRSSGNWAYRLIDRIEKDFSVVIEEKDNLAGIRPKDQLQPAVYDGDGVTVNTKPDADDELILISGFFPEGNENRLMRRDGEIVARWELKYSELFTDPTFRESIPATDWNVATHGIVANPDGSLVFNFEYGGLVKLDRCNNVLWTLRQQSHHSVERSERGGYWVPGRIMREKGDPKFHPVFVPPYREDTIMRVSDDGEVLLELSVPQLLVENGLAELLTATGSSMNPNRFWDLEIVHLNKVAELSSELADDFPLFEAGDLVLSLRQFNMILVVDPDTRKIKWWKVGPWRRQHDPEFIPGGKIIVFNNNTYTTMFGQPIDLPDLPTHSEIIEINPVTNEHRVLYGGTEDEQFFTTVKGKHQYTPQGGLLITEFDGGRIFETDADRNIVWEYINRFDEDEVAELTEARMYPESYFNFSDWSCKTS